MAHASLDLDTFLWDTYIGGDQYLSGDYLFSHKREHGASFDDRKRRAYFPNFSQPIIDLYTSHLFQPGVVRTIRNAAFEEFSEDVDRQGTTLDNFMRHVSAYAQVFGRMLVLVDKVRVDRPVQTRLQERELGVDIPYFGLIDPRDVVGFQVDRFGELEWIRLQERPGVQRDPFTGRERPGPKLRLRVWTREEWAVLEGDTAKNLRQVGRDTHGLGIVPVVPFYNRKIEPLVGLSALQDIAFLNREIFNISSLLQEFLYRQSFSIPAIPAEMAEAGDELRIGTSWAVFYPMDARTPPYYMTPPTEPAQFMLDYVGVLVDQIARFAKMPPGEPPRAERPRTGPAREFDFAEMNRTLNDKADQLEAGERRLWKIWHRWQDQEPDPGDRVDYPEEFSVSTLSQDIDDALSMKSLGLLSPTFAGHLYRKLYGKAGLKLGQDVLRQIEREVHDALADQPEQGFLSPTMLRRLLAYIPADRLTFLPPEALAPREIE